MTAQQFATEPRARDNRRGNGIAIAVVVLVVGLLAAHFCSLQTKYYSHYQPFFDSLSYYNEIHRVMITGQQDGLASSLSQAWDTRSTVFMPRMIAALTSPWFQPSRNFGVWLQAAELCLLTLSLLYYFRVVKQLAPLPALILIASFSLTACLYESHGGMSDFRMDLSLHLTYSLSCVWYLIAARTKRPMHFVVLGVAIAAACLFRATAPVYLLLSLGPVALAELALANERKPLLTGLVIASGTATLGALWFYIANFDQLHYYYFVWNTDANAKLALTDSVQHIDFALRHVGPVLFYWLALMSLLQLFVHWQNGPRSGVFSTTLRLAWQSVRQTDLRLLWFAAAPLSMLVLRGAGLNPFVSMPAVCGILLLAIHPFANDRLFFSRRSTTLAAAALTLIAFAAIAKKGWESHEAGKVNSMAAHHQVIRHIVDDAQNEGIAAATFDSTHMCYLHPYSIESTLRFDTPDSAFRNDSIRVDGVRIDGIAVFSDVVAQANWNALSGTREQRLQHLISEANERLDYLIVPIESSVAFLEQHVAHNVINQHQSYLRQGLLSDSRWVPISGVIKNSDNEQLQIFKNVERIDIATRQSRATDTLVR